jgi:hypothetical protein
MQMAYPEPTQRLGRFVETLVAGEIVRAFVLAPLPPTAPIDVLVLLDRLSLAEPPSPTVRRRLSIRFLMRAGVSSGPGIRQGLPPLPKRKASSPASAETSPDSGSAAA